MIDLPGHGQRVKVWPIPGREVPSAPVSIGQESFNTMPADGQLVTWDPYHYELLIHGQISLHDPRHHDGAHAVRRFTADAHFHAAKAAAIEAETAPDLEEARILAMPVEEQAKERIRIAKMNERHAAAAAKAPTPTPAAPAAAPKPEGKV